MAHCKMAHWRINRELIEYLLRVDMGYSLKLKHITSRFRTFSRKFRVDIGKIGKLESKTKSNCEQIKVDQIGEQMEIR